MKGDWADMLGRPEDYDQPRDGGVSDARLDQLFGMWAAWMQTGANIARGYPTKTPGVRSSGAQDIDDMYRTDVELRNARMMDAIIDSLPTMERTSISHVYLASVWRLREPMEVVYPRARSMVRAILKRRRVE